MYRLQSLQSDQWLLMNEQDEVVFRGTLADCEAWLDREENHAAPASRNSFSVFRLQDWIHHIWSRTPTVPMTYSTGSPSSRVHPRS